MAKPGRPADPINPTLEEAAAIVGGLVRNFAEGECHSCSSSAYSEAQARKDSVGRRLASGPMT